MLVSFACKHCDQRYMEVEDSVGQMTLCRVCGQAIWIKPQRIWKRFVVRLILLSTCILAAVVVLVGWWWTERLPTAGYVREKAFAAQFGTLYSRSKGFRIKRRQRSVVPEDKAFSNTTFEFDLAGRYLRISDARHPRLHDSLSGFDGEWLWRRSAAGQLKTITFGRDISLLILWMRSGYWCFPHSPVLLSVNEELSNDSHIGLDARLPDGRFSSVIYVDRKTWLPDRYEYVYGGESVRYEFLDYRNVRDGKFPMRAEAYVDGELAGETWTQEACWINAFPEDHFVARADVSVASYDPGQPKVVPAAAGPGPMLTVEPRVNGQYVGRFLIDTGAFTTTIYDRRDSKLDLPLLETHRGKAIGPKFDYREHFAESVELGPVRLESTVVHMLTLASRSQFAGVVGMDVLGRAICEFDSRNRRLVLHDPQEFELTRGEWLPSMGDYSFQCPVKISTCGEKMLCLDTGSHGGVFLGEPHVEQSFSTKSGNIGWGKGFGGGAGSLLSSQLPWIEFAGIRMEDVPISMDVEPDSMFVGSPYCDGLLGVLVMRHFRVFFDLQNRRFAFVTR